MPAISALALLALVSLLPAQTTAEAIGKFQRGEYVQARQMLEQIAAAAPDDRTAGTFLALSRAATGACDAARNDLQQQFTNNPEMSLRRLAGIALVQCHLARNRFAEVWPVLSALER